MVENSNLDIVEFLDLDKNIRDEDITQLFLNSYVFINFRGD